MSLKIIFKDVGGGDSIILEWEKDGVRHIGFIDVNLKSKSNNPVLAYLKTEEIDVIDFIILSHPHEDHYSGTLELLNYCASNNINIKCFGHTFFTDFRTLRSAVKSASAVTSLGHIFKWRYQYTKGSDFNCPKIIDKERYIVQGGTPIQLYDDVLLEYLLPTEVEFASFNSGAYKSEPDNNENSSSVANILSTLIRIGNAEWYVLLSSDVCIPPIKRISYDSKKNLNHFFRGKLILSQAPHHGSIYNHSKIFWRTRSRDLNTPVVFSNAINDKHHPSLSVVENYKQANYEVYSTNSNSALLHGTIAEVDSVKEKIDALEILNISIVEDFIIPSKFSGDKVFIIKDKKALYLPL